MLNGKITIVPIEENIINQVLEIADLCSLTPWSAKDYIEEINRVDSFNIACLVNNSKKIAGFLVARLIRTKPFPLNNLSIDYLKPNKDLQYFELECEETEILNIAVAPKVQQNGIGQQIMDNFINFCLGKKIKTIWLEVRESNYKAKRFYQKNGFEEVYTRKNYYQNPVENGLIMRLELKHE